MLLDLSDTERRGLAIALDAHLASLRNELVPTDDRAYRQMLRERLDMLERVAQRVTVLAPEKAAPARPA
jgi:hypothetical protein